jgi:DNA-binding NarL/FixJ family response regulator
MLRIALLDDHPAVLAGLRRLIDAEPDLSVAAIGATSPELARELNGLRPDVLILDYDLVRDDGLAHCRRIKSRPNAPAVVVYSAYAGPALTLAARAAQADAVVDKAEPVHTLLAAVRRAAGGEVVMGAVPRDAFEAAVARMEDEDLPVFAMLLDREPYDSIAEALRIDQAEVSRRAQRIVGRLRPRRSVDVDDVSLQPRLHAIRGVPGGYSVHVRQRPDDQHQGGRRASGPDCL